MNEIKIIIRIKEKKNNAQEIRVDYLYQERVNRRGFRDVTRVQTKHANLRFELRDSKDTPFDNLGEKKQKGKRKKKNAR